MVAALRKTGKPRDGCLSALRQRMVHKGIHRNFLGAAARFESTAGRKRSAWWKHRERVCDKMADVGVLFSRLAATTLSDRSQAHARAGQKRIASSRNDWRDAVTAKFKAIKVSR